MELLPILRLAQQNDLFDIQKHLQKKQKEDKKIDDKIKLVLPPLKKVNLYNSYTKNSPTLSYPLSNGDKIITLEQDNMPCVVTDMSLFQAMPNPGYNKNFIANLSLSYRQYGQIPNGALSSKKSFQNKILEQGLPLTNFMQKDNKDD